MPDYWEKGKPYLDKVTVRVVPDPTVRLTMVRTGEVDLATDVDAKDVPALAGRAERPRLRDEASCPVDRSPVAGEQAPFNNKALRQAIALAINRTRAQGGPAQRLRRAGARPGRARALVVRSRTSKASARLRAAKRKLAEAGYPNGFRHKFVVENTPQWIRQAELLQGQLQKINVTLELEPVNTADAYALIVQRKTQLDTYSMDASGPIPTACSSILFHSKGFANSTGYSNPRVDELHRQGGDDLRARETQAALPRGGAAHRG